MRAMRAAPLGSNGPPISVIGLGAWEAGGADWGPNESEDAVVDAMRAALDVGITWIDTAEVYGKGVSEELVGRAIVGRRDEVFVATKVAPADEGSGFAPAEVRAACAASLARLGIDRIDLYQLHWPDSFGTSIEDTWETMCELQDAGLVHYLGVSNFTRELIERCLPIRHVDSLQQEFSMLALDDRELIRWCGERGIGVLSYSPLGAGLLTGSLARERVASLDDWRGSDRQGLFSESGLDRAYAMLAKLSPIADRLGISLSQLALAWNLAQPGVTAAIAGSRNPDHIRMNAAAGDIELDLPTLGEIEALL
jgi:aryl-alcohol dehydrogenase-like predicted oxidoreductase